MDDWHDLEIVLLALPCATGDVHLCRGRYGKGMVTAMAMTQEWKKGFWFCLKVQAVWIVIYGIIRYFGLGA